MKGDVSEKQWTQFTECLMPIESSACIIPLPQMRESPFVNVDPVIPQKGPDTVNFKSATRWAHDSFGCVKLTQCKERTLQRWKNQGKSILLCVGRQYQMNGCPKDHVVKDS